MRLTVNPEHLLYQSAIQTDCAGSLWSDREKWSTSKGGPVFSNFFRLDRTDPLSFGPKFPEILVEWIAPIVSFSKSFTYFFVLFRKLKGRRYKHFLYVSALIMGYHVFEKLSILTWVSWINLKKLMTKCDGIVTNCDSSFYYAVRWNCNK